MKSNLCFSNEEEHPTPAPRSRSSPGGGAYDIYASLPRSLKQEVLVRSKIEEDEELVNKIDLSSVTVYQGPSRLTNVCVFDLIQGSKTSGHCGVQNSG